MFERFTEPARRVIVLAQAECRLLNHDYVGTEHILLALLSEGESPAARVLQTLGVTLEAARSEVEGLIGRGQAAPSGEVPFTPRAKKVMEHALRVSLHFELPDIGPEHILLGLINEPEGVGAQVLTKLGAQLDNVRAQVIDLLPTPEKPRKGRLEALTANVAARRGRRTATGPVCPGCRQELSSTAAYRMIDVPSEDGRDTRRIVVVFCNHCGRTVGAYPD